MNCAALCRWFRSNGTDFQESKSKLGKRRLKKRSTDSPREILKRLKIAKQEIAQAKRYDYVVVNKNLKNAAAELKTIIRAERLRVK